MRSFRYFGDTPKFQRNISPPSKGSKNKPSKRLAETGDKLSVRLEKALIFKILKCTILVLFRVVITAKHTVTVPRVQTKHLRLLTFTYINENVEVHTGVVTVDDEFGWMRAVETRQLHV
jgi:hypothetical protein